MKSPCDFIKVMEVYRVGFGYDAHRLVPDRPLILGGVPIPHSTGLLGHSDADVLTHAVMDAVIGALGRGDIGRHFPDTDPAHKDADSLILLEKIMALSHQDGFVVNNVDATIVAQKPKLASFLSAMRERLAGKLGVAQNLINIKATTTERMGFCGREEGMAAYAVVSLVKQDPQP